MVANTSRGLLGPPGGERPGGGGLLAGECPTNPPGVHRPEPPPAPGDAPIGGALVVGANIAEDRHHDVDDPSSTWASPSTNSTSSRSAAARSRPRSRDVVAGRPQVRRAAACAVPGPAGYVEDLLPRAHVRRLGEVLGDSLAGDADPGEVTLRPCLCFVTAWSTACSCAIATLRSQAGHVGRRQGMTGLDASVSARVRRWAVPRRDSPR